MIWSQIPLQTNLIMDANTRIWKNLLSPTELSKTSVLTLTKVVDFDKGFLQGCVDKN